MLATVLRVSHRLATVLLAIHLDFYYENRKKSVKPTLFLFYMKEYFDKHLDELINVGKDKQAIKEIIECAIHMLTMGAHIAADRLREKLEALRLFTAAFALDENNPKLCTNLANIYYKLGIYDSALDFSRKAIAGGGNFLECYINHALILKVIAETTNVSSYKEALPFYEEAKEYLKKALELAPNNASLHIMLAENLFNLHQFAEAMPHYEWRMKMVEVSMFRNRFRDFWDGVTPIKGKRILVFNEQGLGDGFNFARHLKRLKELGAYVIFEVIDSQADIFNELADEIITRKGGLQTEESDFFSPLMTDDYDYSVSLTTLQYYFDPNFENTLVGPYLTISPNPQNEAVQIINKSDKFKVGIIWAGNSTHGNDENRSVPLKVFQPISEIESVQLFSLQKGETRRGRARPGETIRDGYELDMFDLSDGAENVKFIELKEYLTNFKATAEILLSLDLLITVDSSVGHLAGAMGVPVWILMPKIHDWRWHFQWYKSYRIFWQKKIGYWEDVIDNVVNALKETI
jgi:tetratricopeptide (TPR) repeat protein